MEFAAYAVIVGAVMCGAAIYAAIAQMDDYGGLYERWAERSLARPIACGLALATIIGGMAIGTELDCDPQWLRFAIGGLPFAAIAIGGVAGFVRLGWRG